MIHRDELKQLVDGGLSIREIADRIGMSFTGTKYWVDKYGLITHKTPRKCRCKCGETDPSKFYGHKKTVCGACHNRYTIDTGKEKRRRIVSALGGKCSMCGYNKYISALEVHHTEPGKKDPGFRHIRQWTWEKIEKELVGCVLLCGNCHAGLHSGFEEVNTSENGAAW